MSCMTCMYIVHNLILFDDFGHKLQYVDDIDIFWQHILFFWSIYKIIKDCKLFSHSCSNNCCNCCNYCFSYCIIPGQIVEIIYLFMSIILLCYVYLVAFIWQTFIWVLCHNCMCCVKGIFRTFLYSIVTHMRRRCSSGTFFHWSCRTHWISFCSLVFPHGWLHHLCYVRPWLPALEWVRMAIPGNGVGLQSYRESTSKVLLLCKRCDTLLKELLFLINDKSRGLKKCKSSLVIFPLKAFLCMLWFVRGERIALFSAL